MIKAVNLSDRIIKWSNLFICGLLCLIFAFLSFVSIVSTSIIDPQKFVAEHILYFGDNVVLNFILIGIFAFILYKLIPHIDKINPKIATVILILYTFVLGTLWVTSVKSIPAADSGTVVNAAQMFLKGNYSELLSNDSYFKYFPFQLGIVFIYELLLRIFGSGNIIALGKINIICLCSIFIALIQLSKLIFNNKKIENLTIILLAGCLQPILFCTFIYGNIIGLAFAIWAVIFQISYIKNGKKYMMILSTIFIAISIIAKLNNMIILIAMCIILALHFLKNRKVFSIIAIVMCIAVTFAFSNLVIQSYELRSDVDLGDGVPKLLWADMGLQESFMASGWYNGHTIIVFRKNNYNSEISKQEAKAGIEKRITYFLNNPQYTLNFFTTKVISQWNEPSYESIWVSQVKTHTSPVPSFVDSAYEGQLGKILSFYFNIYQQIIFIGFFIALLSNIKKSNLLFSFLPLIILGGFIYHLIFEAKSQYILTYFVLLVPYAACGLYEILQKKQQ